MLGCGVLDRRVTEKWNRDTVSEPETIDWTTELHSGLGTAVSVHILQTQTLVMLSFIVLCFVFWDRNHFTLLLNLRKCGIRSDTTHVV